MNNWRKIELTIYILVTAVILAFPFFDHPNDAPKYWFRVFQDVKRFFPFILLFFVNAEFLVPNFLLKKKYIGYFSSVLFVLSLVLFFSYSINFKRPQQPHDPPLHEWEAPTRRLPQQQFQRPPRLNEMPPPRRMNIWLFNQILLNILVVGLGTGIKISYYWFLNEQVRKDLEKENLKSELAFLKTQISPHFFLNTLNNIHALTDINVHEAQKAILELSRMMRYLLYESERGNTALEKEIEFLKSYIDLMRRRIDENVDIQIKLPENIEGIVIPPLLFISFIENAFKYGVSYKHKSFIHIELMLISRKELLFMCTNSIHENDMQKTKDSGIGLVNIRKRLDLLYNDTYSLSINEGEHSYKTILKIPIHEN